MTRLPHRKRFIGWGESLRELSRALRRVSLEYQDIDRMKKRGQRTFEVEAALFPMTRDEGDHFIECLCKNERIEVVSQRRDEALRKQRICRLSVQATNMACADAAVRYVVEAISQALYAADIMLDGMTVESMLPDVPFKPDDVLP